MAILKQKKMIVQKQVSLATLGSAISDVDVPNAVSASLYGTAIKFDLPASNAVAGGITTTKNAYLLIPMADLAAQFPTIFNALGQGLKEVLISGGNITFTGTEVDFS